MVLLLSSRCAVNITRTLLIAANIPSALNKMCPSMPCLRSHRCELRGVCEEGVVSLNSPFHSNPNLLLAFRQHGELH